MFNKAQLITEGENMISSCTDFSVFFYCWWIFRFWQVIQYFLQSSWSLLIEWISSTSGYLTVRLLLRFTAPNFNRSLYDSLLEPASRGHRRCFLHNSMERWCGGSEDLLFFTLWFWRPAKFTLQLFMFTFSYILEQ